MRTAALYDIHGNLPALDAVLDDVRQSGVDQVVIGGDVLPGPMPVETLTRLLALDLPTRFIHGNGDRMVLEALRGSPPTGVPERIAAVLRWTATQLRPEHERALAGWPPTLRLEDCGLGSVFFCHATPRNDTEIFTRLTPEPKLLPLFDRLGVPVVICGHTHMQFDRTVGRTRVVNAGSVGMPFQEPGAYWLLIDTDITLKRTDYDLAAAADRIRATAYPDAAEFATGNVIRPPAESQMLEALSKAELVA